MQAYRDLFYWGGRMSGLVQDLTASMEAHPPPAHSLGAHLLNAKYPDGETRLLLLEVCGMQCEHCQSHTCDTC